MNVFEPLLALGAALLLFTFSARFVDYPLR